MNAQSTSQSCHLVNPGEGDAYWTLGDLITFKVGPQHTNNQWSIAETTVVPYLDQGAVTGLLLSRLPLGILSDVGLRQGDVLQSLNDVPVDSLATLASLWPRFQNATEVRAVVLRDGRPLNLTVSLH